MTRRLVPLSLTLAVLLVAATPAHADFPKFTRTPVVEGSRYVGQTARCSWESAAALATVRYTWLRDAGPGGGQGSGAWIVSVPPPAGEVVAGATGPELTLGPQDAGRSLSCHVRLENADGWSEALSRSIAPVNEGPPVAPTVLPILPSLLVGDAASELLGFEPIARGVLGAFPAPAGIHATLCGEGGWGMVDGPSAKRWTFELLRDGRPTGRTLSAPGDPAWGGYPTGWEGIANVMAGRLSYVPGFRLQAADAGRSLTCRVTLTNAFGSATAISPPVSTAWVGDRPALGAARVAPRGVLRRGGFSLTVSVPETARITAQARGAKVTLAGGQASVRRAGSVSLRLRLTTAGRRALRRHARIAAVVSVAAPGMDAARLRVTLRR